VEGSVLQRRSARIWGLEGTPDNGRM
jgi:hypothetical protein